MVVFTISSLVKRGINKLSFENSNRYVVKGVISHKIIGESYDTIWFDILNRLHRR